MKNTPTVSIQISLATTLVGNSITQESKPLLSLLQVDREQLASIVENFGLLLHPYLLFLLLSSLLYNISLLGLLAHGSCMSWLNTGVTNPRHQFVPVFESRVHELAYLKGTPAFACCDHN